jgi:tRNA-splicing ligase RtcB
MYIELEHKGTNPKLWTNGVPVEQDAITQIRAMQDLAVVHGPIAIMPDVHVGVGAVVGSVIPTKGAIIPSAVGVDIGCGMAAIQLSLKAKDLPESLLGVRNQIEHDVPVGFNGHAKSRWYGQYKETGAAVDAHLKGFGDLAIKARLGTLADQNKIESQMGSLGGGNHFIELCLDTEDNVWVMLHSGSRNIGKTIGECAINMAKEKALREGIKHVDASLAWLDQGSVEFDMYTEGLLWAQKYARLNRDVMMVLVLNALEKHLPKFTIVRQAINCHHNYASFENHNGEELIITRKGAVSAKKGELGIIPGSMGAKSFIVRGLGNENSYCSCSHGAGRKLSRGAAKRAFTVADLEEQTKGIECRKDAGVVDEIPGAYKDIDAVMAAQSDLVEVVAQLRQVMCVKG